MSTHDPYATGPVIGLVGGLGVGATVHYYRQLAGPGELERDALRLVMIHASIARTTECAARGDRHGLAAYLAGLLTRLKAAGATFGVVPAVTPHICVDQLRAVAPLPVVDIIAAVSDHIHARQLSRVAMFGTRVVIESDLFGRLRDVDVVRPLEPEIAFIHDAYSQLARTAAVSADHRARLIALAETLVAREGVEAIVLAGTDFSLMFDTANTPFPHVDCAGAHLDAIRQMASSAAAGAPA